MKFSKFRPLLANKLFKYITQASFCQELFYSFFNRFCVIAYLYYHLFVMLSSSISKQAVKKDRPF